MTTRRIETSWSETAFRARVKARADALGVPLSRLLAAAKVGKDTIDKIPRSGRRIDTLEKIAQALDWSLAELMGHGAPPGQISIETSKKAYASAERVLARLPSAFKTTDRLLLHIHASFYDVWWDQDDEPDAAQLQRLEDWAVRLYSR